MRNQPFSAICIGLSVLCLMKDVAWAQNTDRAASFLPPSVTTVPVATAPNPTAAFPPTDPSSTPLITSPLPLTPSASVVAPPASVGITSAPSAVATTIPMAITPAVTLGAAVESGTLPDISPESIGLLDTKAGGLGANLWQGTPRILVERLLPALSLPTDSPALNDLARRFLLTTAAAPTGSPLPTGPSLLALRLEKLVALGDATSAWRLAMLAKPDQIDDITLHLVVEAALVSPSRADTCAKLPDLMKNRDNADWQKALLVCQLAANDSKAAQLTVEVMRTQPIKDDTFFDLADKNILGGGKFLPRQLTPLKPLSLALLQIANKPLRSEVYARPDAGLIPALLQIKATDDKARLDLAERAAARGVIDVATLGDVYRSLVFQPDQLAGALTSKETGARLHALLYQALQNATTPQDRIALAVAFLRSLSADDRNGTVGRLLAQSIDTLAPAPDFYAVADEVTQIHIMGGRVEMARAWLAAAKTAAIGLPAVAARLQALWPLVVVAGLESDKDYAKGLTAWLDATLTPASSTDPLRPLRARAASVLLLLEADGFAVPDDAWAKVADMGAFDKNVTPPVLLMTRLRAAGILNKRGEAVLDGLIAAAGAERSLATTLDLIRALRLVGLANDATALTREAMLEIADRL